MSIKNITWPVFLILVAVAVILIYTNTLPNDMVGAFSLMLIMGLVFGEIGDRTPIVKDYLGGGPIVCIFLPAILLHFKLLPQYVADIMTNFMNNMNFFAFFIAIMVAGAILSLSRKIIIKASIRYVPALFGGIIVSFLAAAGVGLITGYGVKDAIFDIAIPVMGGGVGAGALPLSQIYAGATGGDAATILSTIMPAVVLANVVAILVGVQLNRLGKKRPKLTGNGLILKVEDKELMAEIEADTNKGDTTPMDVKTLGAGFLVCLGFYLIALLINKFIFPGIHTFVWLILLLTVAKAAKLLPEHLEVGTIQWSRIWTKNLIYGALIPIGLGFVNITTVVGALTNVSYLLVIVATVLGAAIGAGLVGHFVGLYFVESSIASGLCMANMAQTGDLAVLSASKRMQLLPFAAFSSRIGGSIILVLAGFIVSMFL
ncbi:MAG: 2-hydroxycarboxylate transporter family protein [Eubacteriales bacterium]|nr:2-hydroxycarboxylate transporter family protein [Eubacteriales bacterium]